MSILEGILTQCLMRVSEVKIVPYRPLPFRDGNKVVERYTEPFTDRIGNEAEITYVDYLDKKGKLNERFVMYIKWRKK